MPVISISRQFGAGGHTLAEKLAGRTGYRLANQELIRRIAELTGCSDEWVRLIDRESDGHKKKGVSGFVGTLIIERMLAKETRDDHALQLRPYLEKVMPEIAAQGRVIFVGRGSQFILPDTPKFVKILLVASITYRINFLMENYKLTPKEAEETVRDWDHNRRIFLSEFTSRDPDDPSHYDIVINTSLVRPDWALNLIAEVLRKKTGDTSMP